MVFSLKPFNRDVPDDQLLADLKNVYARLHENGKPLTFRSYGEMGAYSASTINTRFGSWNIALQRAGLIPTEEKSVSTEALFDNLRNVWIEVGRQPSFRDMSKPPSRYSASTYASRFGGWRKALELFAATNDSGDIVFIAAEKVSNKRQNSRTSRDPGLALKFQVLKRGGFRCAACGRSPANIPGLVLEVDHILAWSKGGETTLSNLQTLCFDCNRGKQAL